jgi:hypothetical protein
LISARLRAAARAAAQCVGIKFAPTGGKYADPLLARFRAASGASMKSRTHSTSIRTTVSGDPDARGGVVARSSTPGTNPTRCVTLRGRLDVPAIVG